VELILGFFTIFYLAKDGFRELIELEGVGRMANLKPMLNLFF